MSLNIHRSKLIRSMNEWVLQESNEGENHTLQSKIIRVERDFRICFFETGQKSIYQNTDEKDSEGKVWWKLEACMTKVNTWERRPRKQNSYSRPRKENGNGSLMLKKNFIC